MNGKPPSESRATRGLVAGVPRSAALAVAFGLALVSLVACDAARAETGTKPPVNVVEGSALSLAIDYPPSATIRDPKWEFEAEYATTDVDAVFDSFDAVLAGLGFAQTGSPTIGPNEVLARYANGEVLAVLEVELDRGRVEAELEFRVRGEPAPAPTGFSLTAFLGMTLPSPGEYHTGAKLVDVEWEFEVEHPNESPQDLFAHYDAQVKAQGWQPAPAGSASRKALYVKDGVYLELEVESDGEVEIELNRGRFY